MFNSIHNSWFRLVKKSEKDEQLTRLDFDKFKEVLHEQILQKAKVIGKTYLCFDDNYIFENLNIILERHIYDQIPLNKGKYFSVLTFHGTSSTTKVNSICKHGYIIPGTKHPTKGWNLHMQTGNLFGDGIYSTTDFKTSQWYSFGDLNLSVQLIINILVVGKVKKVNSKYYSDESGNATENSIPEHYDNFYKDDLGEYDTLMSLDEKIFVSGNNENIIPVAILTMKPAKPYNSPFQTKLLKNNEIKYFDFSDNCLPMINFFGNYNIIDFSKHFEKTQKFKTKHILLIPEKFAYSKESVNFRESVNNFVNSLSPNDKKIVYYYGESNVKKNIENIHDFASFTNTIKIFNLQPKENLLECLTKVFNDMNLCKDPYINIIYMFVNDPTDATNQNLEKIYQHKIFDTLMIKLIFLKNIHKRLCNLKNMYQNTFPFELYYHTTSLTDFGNTADVLLDEYENMSSTTGHLFPVCVKDPYGIIGEGFMETLNEQPVFNINSQELMVLYKGYTSTIILGNKTNESKTFQSSLLVKSKPVVYANKSADKTKVKKETFYSYLHREYIDVLKEIESLKLEINRLSECVNMCKEDFLQKNIKIDNLNIKRNLNDQNNYRHQDYKKSEIYLEYVECCEKLKEKEQYFSKLDYYASDYDDIKKFYLVLIPLISKFRNYLFVHPERCKLYQKFISDLFEVFLERINDYSIDNKFNDTQLKSETEISTINAKIYFEKLYPTFRLRKQIRIVLQKLLSDIKSFGKIKLTGKWMEKLSNMKFSKNMIKRSKNIDLNFEELKISCDIPKNTKIRSIEDILCFVKTKGLLIRTRESSASEIEPWNIMIEYVSKYNDLNMMSFNNLLSLTECGYPIKDINNVNVNNILLENVKTNDKIMKMLYGYIFTRVPNLYITSQPIALVTNTWISILEKIYKMIFLKKQYDKNQMFDTFTYSIKLYEIIKSYVAENQWFIKLKNQLMDFDNIEHNISTKNGIASLTQILACLTSINFSDIPEHLFNKLCVQLITECTIRSCKVACKMEKTNCEHLIANVLGIDLTTIVDKYDEKIILNRDQINESIKKTNKFFMSQYTNCSFFTIVAAIGFIKYSQLNLTPEEIFNKFESSEISSRNFLIDYFKTKKGKITQLGLYIYGMRYFNHDEKNTEYTYPLDFDLIIKKEIDNQINIIKIKKTMSETKLKKYNFNILARIQKGSSYKIYHSGLPTIFTEFEIEELNKTRDPNDQLSLKEGGLLQFHCCYPNCPFYLKKLDDNVKTKSHILLAHLQYDDLFDNYVKGFHKNGMCLAKNSKTYEELYKSMKQMYPKLDFSNEVVETLESIWKKFKKNYKQK